MLISYWEHNLDVIKSSDWVIDMGPEGGFRGGLVVAQGTPEEVAKVKESYTGQFLAEILDSNRASTKASEKSSVSALNSPVKKSTAAKKK
jgi:hypothetical protein